MLKACAAAVRSGLTKGVGACTIRRMLQKESSGRHPLHAPFLAQGWAHGWQAALAVTLALLVARAAYLVWFNPYGLGPDEAQYWHWLTHLQASYLTKPPLTTWLMGVGTTLLGDTALGVRLFALVGQGAAAMLAYAIARHAAGPGLKDRAAWLAFGLVTTAPMVAAGGLLMSPDAVLAPLWLSAVYVLLRYGLPENTPKLSIKPWLAIGLIIGLAGLAKYTAALFFPLVGLYLVLFRRSAFRQPAIYAAGLLALAMQAPVIWWNATHGLAGAEHLLWQTDNGDARYGNLATILNFLAGQVAFIGLVAFPMLLAAWASTALKVRRTAPAVRLLLCLTLPVFLMFLAQTTQAKVQPNWPLLATVPGLVLLAVWAAGLKPVWHKVLVGGMAVSALLSLAFYNTQMVRAVGIPLKLKADPTKDLMGWPELGQITGRYLSGMASSTVVLTTRYQTAAELAFHTPRVWGEVPTVLYLNPGNRRANQYDLWTWPDITTRLTLYVNEQDTLPQAVSNRFATCTKLARSAIMQHSMVVRTGSFYLCWGSPLLKQRQP